MIVKNESHIIQKTLQNIIDHLPIDYWVICDTGSTDNTTESITSFFSEKSIKGELYHHEWKDFGTNRTLALREAYNKTDYLLIFDADDSFEGVFNIPQTSFHIHKFNLKMDGGSYYRPLIVDNRKKWKFTGVLHEYLEKDEEFEEFTAVIQGNYSIHSGRIGNRSKDPEKYKKDAVVLSVAYDKAKEEGSQLVNRYVFYCANSYKDAGMINEAIEWYKKTLTHQGWIQERYVSCLRLFECYERIGQKETGFYYLIKSLEYDKKRYECIYKLIAHYCVENMNDVAYSFYSLIKDEYEAKYISETNGSKLFIDTSYGDFYLPYIMIIVSDRVKQREVGVKMYEIIFQKKFKASEWYLNNLIFNMKFFIDKFRPETLKWLNEYRESYPLFERLCDENSKK
jgi:glycosyltransferase involved in cell wall biosynthesis